MMKALVLSGGGAKGAFQVGVLHSLVQREALAYDIITGVSVGALNGSFLAQYPKADFVRGVDDLRRFWQDIDTPKVYRNWRPFGKLMVPWKPSVYDSKPLWDLVRANLDPEKIRSSGVRLAVGAVNINTGEYRAFRERHPEIVKAVLASSAFPVMLRPVEFETEPDTWTDGGIRNTSPIKAAIDMGASEIDLIMTFPPDLPKIKREKWTALQIALQSIEVLMDEVVETDLDVVCQVNAMVLAGIDHKHRHIKLRVFRPDALLTHDSLDFSPSEIDRMFNEGRRIGRQ